MKSILQVNKGIYIGILWVLLVFAFSIIFANRLNLSGDTAYQWQDPYTFQDYEGWNIGSLLSHWDAHWFVGLARDGYQYKGSDVLSNVVFFPLYPIALRAFKVITNLSYENAGIALNALFIVCIAYLLVQYAKKKYSTANPLLPAAAMLTFPTAIFLLAPYSESLFLLLAILFILLLEKKSFVFAVIVGIAASLTRSMGVLLLIPAFGYSYTYWKKERKFRVFLPLLTVVGTLVYFTWQRFAYGSFFTYFKVESAWGRSFAVNWDHLWLGSPAARVQLILDLCVILFVLCCAVYLWKKRERTFALYTAACVILPASTGTLMSVGRYALAAFPIFFIPAMIRSQNTRALWFFISIMLFGMNLALYVNGYWAG